MQTVTATGHEDRHEEDRDYRALLGLLHTVLGGIQGPLFTTDATGLWDTFLAGLPANRRQHYQCRACKRFVETYGGLVWVEPSSGETDSVMWAEVERGFFSQSVGAIALTVERARITGVFLSSDPTWGNPSNIAKTGPRAGVEWFHLHTVPLPNGSFVYRESPVKNAAQAMAEKHEDFGMLSRGLADFSIEQVRQAHTLLSAGALFRSEKCIGIAKWLLDLHEAREATKNRVARENLVWRAVATAPPGYCHVRTTMISTLLEDIAAGKAFADIKRSFDAKMSPIQYLRPQAGPTDGQLAAAEALISKLASAGSLARRFATLDDVRGRAIWLPKAKGAPADGSVFGHLKSKANGGAIDVPAQNITWEKFSRSVLLPSVDRVEFFVPHGSANFFAFVTAENPEAPPILQWDREDARNPVSMYVYHHGSHGHQWGLAAGTWVDVEAVTMSPPGWSGAFAFAHQSDGACFILRGARDSRNDNLALFPETLRSEYHGIRSAIEAYSRSKKLTEVPEPACGVIFDKGGSGGMAPTLRVTLAGARISYCIDRWD